MNRRSTLKAVAATAAGALLQPDRILGANDRVRVAVCGLNGRGKDHIGAFSRVPNVEIAALCDIDEDLLRRRHEELDRKPRKFVDVRELLEDRSVDAVSIATPNHWHALMTIWACQAGKDVYVEKPCSYNLWEGRQLVRAVEKYGRVVQHGTQARSLKSVQAAIRTLQSGELGEVYWGRGLCFKRRGTIGHAPPEPVPAGVHYDLWTGPAPLKPFTRNRFHYKWHWNWDTGNGDLGNQGVHQIDVARWGLGVGFPNRVSAVGGHFLFDDDQQTPNTLACAFEFDLPDGKRKVMEFAVRHWLTNDEAGIGGGKLKAGLNRMLNRDYTIGDIFYGSKGYLAVGNENSSSYTTFTGRELKGSNYTHGGGDHFANFIDCVRSRKHEDLAAPIQEGHISCGLVHLANASYRVGRTLRFDGQTERVIGDDEANDLLRSRERGYRTPFEVPEIV